MIGWRQWWARTAAVATAADGATRVGKLCKSVLTATAIAFKSPTAGQKWWLLRSVQSSSSSQSCRVGTRATLSDRRRRNYSNRVFVF